MNVFNWLIRIQQLEFYCPGNLPKYNIKFYNNQLQRKITLQNNRLNTTGAQYYQMLYFQVQVTLQMLYLRTQVTMQMLYLRTQVKLQ